MCILLAMKHLLSSKDWGPESLQLLFERAKEFLSDLNQGRSLDLAHGKILASLFFEPSTRTRFSFETAMLRLGGQVISNPEMTSTSSLVKGESLYDTGKTVSQFADIIVMRHPQAGSVAELAKGSEVPVINAGDGAHDHPTQGLLDLFSIWNRFGRLDHLKIAMVGDLKYGRVVHSQCELLAHYSNIEYHFIAPPELQMPQDIVDTLRAKGATITQTEDLSSAQHVDVLSMTRVQKERFPSEAEYLKYKGVYVLNAEFLQGANKNMMIIHPLPRVDEMHPEIDSDPRAAYFEQVRNGVAVRMAILEQFLAL